MPFAMTDEDWVILASLTEPKPSEIFPCAWHSVVCIYTKQGISTPIRRDALCCLCRQTELGRRQRTQ